ncbi:MAG: response regulator [Anaerolineales bacterium]
MADAQNVLRLKPSEEDTKAARQKAQQTHTPIILVVEDDAHLMEGVREILELDEYHVLTASSGLHGLEILKNMERVPDLIVSDIMMPHMDGYQFFEAVRNDTAWVGIPFIFLTAKGEKADIRLGKSMGVDDYVTKPFSAEDLLVAVSSKLERQRQLQSVFSAQLADMKWRILTILNHEFRTPLTYVIAYADMLNRDADEMSLAELGEFLRGVNSGADRLRRLIENFILLVELETGEIQITYDWRKRPLEDYESIIQNAIKHAEHQISEKHQIVETYIAPNLPIVTGDAEYLSAALARLVDNASKFSPPESAIEVSVAHDDNGQVTFSVTDQGRGIPQHELGLIFDSFYQINRKQYEDQGAGSGLAIVHGIARIHRAEISIRSEPGHGSTFSLHFEAIEA